jgi:thymidylate synthase
MNNLDKQYTALLQDILDNGTEKKDRTGTGTISVFGRQIRLKMSDGFPLLTTKKMHWKSIVTELLWFLRGDTNIKFLVDNDCHIWDGDAYKNYLKNFTPPVCPPHLDVQPSYYEPLSKEQFINGIKTDDEFAKKWGELGPIYGAQWRRWDEDSYSGIDQIANLINDLKTNPDSRRLMVSAWNPTYLNHMVLPPCHYGFQLYTRELSEKERTKIYFEKYGYDSVNMEGNDLTGIPTRAISLMWNQRSVDTFLGLPFNIASYGLLLEIIAKAVNMVPDELIGNLGDVHLYSNHIEQAKEQIGRELSAKERWEWYGKNGGPGGEVKLIALMVYEKEEENSHIHSWLDTWAPNVPKYTREPYPLPTLNINTEFWPHEGGSCGEGPLDAIAVINSFSNDNFCKCLLEEDIQLYNYQSHPTIKAPLSN